MGIVPCISPPTNPIFQHHQSNHILQYPATSFSACIKLDLKLNLAYTFLLKTKIPSYHKILQKSFFQPLTHSPLQRASIVFFLWPLALGFLLDARHPTACPHICIRSS
jgi:hypothetical protein